MKKQTIAAGLILLSGIACNAFEILNPSLKTTWGPGNVRFYINLGSAAFDAEANEALADWSQYTGRTHLRGIDSTGPSTWFDYRNEIRWGATNMPSNVLAWTYPNYDWTTGRFIETDIEFNPNFTFSDGGGGGYDIGWVLLHEIGHAIGLGHSTFSGAVMFPYVNYGVTRDLSKDDIAGAQYLYSSVPDTGSSAALLTFAIGGLLAIRKQQTN